MAYGGLGSWVVHVLEVTVVGYTNLDTCMHILSSGSPCLDQTRSNSTEHQAADANQIFDSDIGQQLKSESVGIERFLSRKHSRW